MSSPAKMLKNCKTGRQIQTEVAEIDLPMELLELIFSYLNRRDNIRASAVSRGWLAASVSSRSVNYSPYSPWLVVFQGECAPYEFYNPSDNKTHPFLLPEILGSRFIYARNRWLLLEKPIRKNLFMFCPYTREKVLLPELPLSYEIAAFSGAPTSPNCLVFVLSHQNNISICTCQPGATQWVISVHNIQPQFPLRSWAQVVFFNGYFYCLSLSGQLGVFEVGGRNWHFICNAPCKLLEENPPPEMKWEAEYMAEHDGSLYIVCVCASKAPCIYRVHTGSEVWEEMESLGNVTLFANQFSSQARVDLGGKLVDKIIFSKLIGSGKIVYPPNHCPRLSDRSFVWYKKEFKNRIWIEAPGS